MKATPREWLVSAAERATVPTAPSNSTTRLSSEEKDANAFEIADADDWGVAEQLATSRAIVKGLAAEVRRAASEGRSLVGIDRRWSQASQMLRALEKDAPRIAIDSGAAWNKAEVSEVLIEVGVGVNAAMDRLSLRIMDCVRGELDEAQHGRLHAEIEALINELRAQWSRAEFYVQPD